MDWESEICVDVFGSGKGYVGYNFVGGAVVVGSGTGTWADCGAGAHSRWLDLAMWADTTDGTA